jgi:hypothetical protein
MVAISGSCARRGEAKAIGFDLADAEGITLTALFLGLLADKCRKHGLRPSWEEIAA